MTEPSVANGDRIIHEDGRGQIVVTRFECPNAYSFALIRLLHYAVRRQAKKRALAFRGVAVISSWRTKTMMSITVWDSLQ